MRTYDEGYDCKMACSGDSTTTCGGASSSDVYVVSSGKSTGGKEGNTDNLVVECSKLI